MRWPLLLALCACREPAARPPVAASAATASTPAFLHAAVADAAEVATVDAPAAPSGRVRPLAPRASFGDVPETVPTGSFAASPRRDWPCAQRKRHRVDDEWMIEYRWVNSSRSSCRLPTSYATEGLVGCVERAVSPSGGKTYDISRLSYAGDGTLARRESNLGTETFTWSGETPTGSDDIRKRLSPGRLETDLVSHTVLDVDSDGRPLRLWDEESGKLTAYCEWTWKGTRLVVKQCFDGETGAPTWTVEPMYDCTGLPALGRSANAGGPLGVPLRE